MGNCNFVFKLFNNHQFENGMHEVTYFFIFTCNILICYKNIYQVLVHVCVVLQLHLEVNITNLLWIEFEVGEIQIPFIVFSKDDILGMVWERPCIIRFILLMP